MADGSIKFTNEEQVIRAIRETASVIGTERGVPQKIVAMEAKKGILRHFIESRSAEGVPWRGPKYRKGKPLRDKNILMNSITFLIMGTKVFVGTNDIRGPILNFGGTIRAKGRRMLAIPVDQKGRINGHGPFGSSSFRATFSDAFVISLGGKEYGNTRLWLVRKIHGHKAKRDPIKDAGYSQRGTGYGTLQFLALLVKQVKIPGRPFIGASAETQAKIVGRLHEMAVKAWEKADASGGD